MARGGAEIVHRGGRQVVGGGVEDERFTHPCSLPHHVATRDEHATRRQRVDDGVPHALRDRTDDGPAIGGGVVDLDAFGAAARDEHAAVGEPCRAVQPASLAHAGNRHEPARGGVEDQRVGQVRRVVMLSSSRDEHATVGEQRGRGVVAIGRQAISTHVVGLGGVALGTGDETTARGTATAGATGASGFEPLEVGRAHPARLARARAT